MDAKLKTLLRNLDNGLIRNNTEIILNHIKNSQNGVSTYTMRITLKIPHQSLTAVLSNLLDFGVIQVAGMSSHKESYYSIWKFVCDINEQKRIREIRRVTKYSKWVKLGLREYEDLMPEDAKNSFTKHLYN